MLFMGQMGGMEASRNIEKNVRERKDECGVFPVNLT